MKTFHFRASLTLPCDRARLFDFFSDAMNLEKITPPWLKFNVITPGPLQIEKGTIIDYKLRVRSVPIRWRSQISVWEPPFRFVDEQLRGPYRVWIHEHKFTEVDGGTLCEDHVQYAPIGGAIINRLLVAKDVRTIFEYRSAVLQQLFGGPRANT